MQERKPYEIERDRAHALVAAGTDLLFEGTVHEATDDYPGREFHGRAWDGAVRVRIPVAAEGDVELLRSSAYAAGALADRCVQNLLNQGMLRGTAARTRDSYYGDPVVAVEGGIASVHMTFALALRPEDFPALQGPLDGRSWVAGGGHRILLVGCVGKKKASPAAAKDLYDSPLFAMRRAYAEGSGQPWAVVSAHFRKIILPDTVLDPYDRTLSNLKRDEIDLWQTDAGFAFYEAFGELARGAVVEVHAGRPYVEAMRAALCERWGVTIEAPLAGLGIGEQLAWYKNRGFGVARGKLEDLVREQLEHALTADPDAAEEVLQEVCGAPVVVYTHAPRPTLETLSSRLPDLPDPDASDLASFDASRRPRGDVSEPGSRDESDEKPAPARRMHPAQATMF